MGQIFGFFNMIPGPRLKKARLSSLTRQGKKKCQIKPNQQKSQVGPKKPGWTPFQPATQKKPRLNEIEPNGSTYLVTPGINAELAKDLENPITWIPPLDGGGDDETENVIEKAYQELDRVKEDEAPAAVTPGSIIDGELVDFDEYAHVERGEVVAADEDNIDVAGNQGEGGWSVAQLMQR
ncbi:hypothetical protein B0H10DRAFT_1950996 [Mycena sp. CBHHK59/15]|nr:hypothetical protein B0H10DRAFT_1950996 [Mycena sp. CBHHK59/15]